MIDPLGDPAPLVARVYAYVAYRLGDGADAEDVTSETFARALRYRSSFDSSAGSPTAWLIGIARRCIADWQREAATVVPTEDDHVLDRATEGTAEVSATRLDLAAAVAALGARDRELIALRYGSDLKVKDIATVLGERTNTVEVALHRALERLRELLDGPQRPAARRKEAPGDPAPATRPAPGRAASGD